MRRAALLAVAVLVALAGTVAIVSFLQSREDSDIGATDDGPGVAAPDETEPRLRAGNLVLTHRSQADGPALRALAEDLAGPPDPALEEAGQAIAVEHRPDQAQAVVARAYRRRLEADSARDPALRRFAEYWLGRGQME